VLTAACNNDCVLCIHYGFLPIAVSYPQRFALNAAQLVEQSPIIDNGGVLAIGGNPCYASASCMNFFLHSGNKTTNLTFLDVLTGKRHSGVYDGRSYQLPCFADVHATSMGSSHLNRLVGISPNYAIGLAAHRLGHTARSLSCGQRRRARGLLARFRAVLRGRPVGHASATRRRHRFAVPSHHGHVGSLSCTPVMHHSCRNDLTRSTGDLASFRGWMC